MEDVELQNIWKAYDRKIEEARVLNLQSWALNLKCFETIQTQKAVSKLNKLATFKKFLVALGILYVLPLGLLVYAVGFKNLYFSVSISMITLITVIAIIVYIKHIFIIKQINYSESIADAQQKISRLQSSTISVARILFLQLPFHCTWMWSSNWIIYSSWKFWLILFPVFLSFTLLAIWLYRNISFKNADKKWFKLLFGTTEWTSLIKAKKFLTEIDSFKQELI